MCPVLAATSAMPEPMIPDPMIPIRSIATAIPLSLVTGHSGERQRLPLGRFRRLLPTLAAAIGAPTSVLTVSTRKTVTVEGLRRFPKAVETELGRRHAQALAGSSGRVLDLSDPGARIVLREAIDNGVAPGGSQWDIAISVAELIRFPDLTASLNAIDALLAPDGRLLAIEPVVRPGTLRVLGLAPWSATRSVRGFHVGRDIAAALRTTPLVNDDIERFTLPTAVVPLRHFVSVGARRVVTVSEVEQ